MPGDQHGSQNVAGVNGHAQVVTEPSQSKNKLSKLGASCLVCPAHTIFFPLLHIHEGLAFLPPPLSSSLTSNESSPPLFYFRVPVTSSVFTIAPKTTCLCDHALLFSAFLCHKKFLFMKKFMDKDL